VTLFSGYYRPVLSLHLVVCHIERSTGSSVAFGRALVAELDVILAVAKLSYLIESNN
jgi:hypothetical protein